MDTVLVGEDCWEGRGVGVSPLNCLQGAGRRPFSKPPPHPCLAWGVSGVCRQCGWTGLGLILGSWGLSLSFFWTLESVG